MTILKKIGQLAGLAEEVFDVTVRKGLSLFTIRHFDEASKSKYLGQFDPILVQQKPDTLQFLFAG